MEKLTEELKKLRDEDPDIILIMDTFREIEEIYNGSIEANEFTEEISPIVNSAEVKVSFQSPLSSVELKDLIPIRTDENK